MQAFRRRSSIGLISMIMSAAMVTGFTRAESPDGPRVKAMIEKGAQYLEKDGASDQVGGKCLIALALYKAGKAVHQEGVADHPKVVEAIDAIRGLLKTNQRNPSIVGWQRMYTPCIAMIFLCEYDQEKYRSEIKTLLEFVYARQVKQGAWGYTDNDPVTADPHYRLGDVSQTQYACLALWYARKKVGIKVPKARGKAVLEWLVKTQSPDGDFFYLQSIPPNGIGERSHSIAAAGMCSVYITCDWLGLNTSSDPQEPKVRKTQDELGLPATVRLVGSDGSTFDFANESETVQVENLDRCKEKGNAWFAKNFNIKTNPEKWQYYYMYGFERYASFREMAEGVNDPEPIWYNMGVDLLTRLQRQDGSWGGAHPQATPGVDTAFAMLFLLRSTKKSLNAVYDGGLTGGGELGEGKLALRNGKIVGTVVTKNVGDLLSMEGASDPDWDKFAENLGDLRLDDDQKSRAQQLAKIRSLVSHKNYQARMIAVKQLGKLRDFDSVPVLIFALGDPDLGVANASHEALRIVSRKFDAAPAGDDATLETFKNLKRIWEKWYLQVEPNALFLD